MNSEAEGKTMKRALFSAVIFALALAAPAAAQDPTPRITVEPYLGYGFFGQLPGAGPNLQDGIAYGARAAYHLTPQWAAFGNFQRSNPQIADTEVNMTVDHWAAGVEFSYVPRGGAEGMLPIILEAGLGQARYQAAGAFAATNDLAAKLGASSALRLTPNLGVRYGVDVYFSNYGPADEGIATQWFPRVGAEIRF